VPGGFGGLISKESNLLSRYTLARKKLTFCMQAKSKKCKWKFVLTGKI
jgi:hypothetical protein